MILAPLRGVTIRTFRRTFAEEILSSGFNEAFTPFVPAMIGCDPLADRELKGGEAVECGIRITPQVIGKDPIALKTCLDRIRAAGYATADLNVGCPFPMVRNKGRGSGLLRTPDILRRMLEVGCETMGDGNFSMKTRLGVDCNDELASIMPMINDFPLRFLTVHARNARQMYEGECDRAAFDAIRSVARMTVVYNGDADVSERDKPLMVGRAFIRHLGTGERSQERLRRYLNASQSELCGDRPVLGRMKELVAYWRDLPHWRRLWPVMKLARTVNEFERLI